LVVVVVVVVVMSMSFQLHFIDEILSRLMERITPQKQQQQQQISCRFTTLNYLLCTKTHLCHSILKVYLGLFFVVVVTTSCQNRAKFQNAQKKAKKKQVIEEET
jgi:hypothetical protein